MQQEIKTTTPSEIMQQEKTTTPSEIMQQESKTTTPSEITQQENTSCFDNQSKATNRNLRLFFRPVPDPIIANAVWESSKVAKVDGHQLAF